MTTADPLDHIVVVVDLKQPADNLAVVWHVCILELVNMHHDLFYLLHSLGRTYPEFPLWLLEALRLDLLDLSDRVVSLFSPFKLLVQEVEHRKVETPHIVASSQINAHVRVQRSKGDGSSEIGTFSLRNRHIIAVKMLLGQSEIDYEDLSVFFAHDKIRSLHISVNESSFVDFSHRNDHFHQNLNGNLEVIPLL